MHMMEFTQCKKRVNAFFYIMNIINGHYIKGTKQKEKDDYKIISLSYGISRNK